MALSTSDTCVVPAQTGSYYTQTESANSGVSSATLSPEALAPIIAKLVANISQGLSVPGRKISQGCCGSEGTIQGRDNNAKPISSDEHGVFGSEEGGVGSGVDSSTEPGGHYQPPVHRVCGNEGDGEPSGKHSDSGHPETSHLASHGACGDDHCEPVAPRMSADDAIETLIKNFSLLAQNGLISADTLKKAAHGQLPDMPKSVQHAAQYLMAHPDVMNSTETALGRHNNNAREATKDGLISLSDLRLEKENRQRPAVNKPMTEAGAVHALQRNFMLLRNPSTGLISTSSLLHAAKGEFKADASPAEKAEAKKAAQFFIDHPDALTALETADGRRLGNSVWSKPDDLISLGDINSQIHSLDHRSEKTKKPQQHAMTEQEAIKDLQDSMKLLADPATGLISTSSLLHAAKGMFARDASPEDKVKAKKAAQYFIDHPAQLTSVDTAYGRKIGNHKAATPDDLISAADLSTEASNLAGKPAKENYIYWKDDTTGAAGSITDSPGDHRLLDALIDREMNSSDRFEMNDKHAYSSGMTPAPAKST